MYKIYRTYFSFIQKDVSFNQHISIFHWDMILLLLNIVSIVYTTFYLSLWWTLNYFQLITIMNNIKNYKGMQLSIVKRWNGPSRSFILYFGCFLVLRVLSGTRVHCQQTANSWGIQFSLRIQSILDSLGCACWIREPKNTVCLYYVLY